MYISSVLLAFVAGWALAWGLPIAYFTIVELKKQKRAANAPADNLTASESTEEKDESVSAFQIPSIGKCERCAADNTLTYKIQVYQDDWRTVCGSCVDRFEVYELFPTYGSEALQKMRHAKQAAVGMWMIGYIKHCAANNLDPFSAESKAKLGDEAVNDMLDLGIAIGIAQGRDGDRNSERWLNDD
ncbi:MAG: hypothetical protein OXG84_16840 [Chloroflexi bacterium]|nr:hypothetical protein [Chloroflexota bacterium]